MLDYLLFWLFFLAILLFSLSIHEYSHGYVAYLLGDPTPQRADRLSLNPLKHLDILGTLSLILTQAIGWAKPVPINPNYFKNPLRDVALVAVAGPLANLLLSFIFAFIFNLTEIFSFSFSLPFKNIFSKLLYLSARVNLALAIFNILPIPPLDGSKILLKYLPPKIRYNYLQLELVGFLLILFLAITGLLSLFLSPLLNFFMNVIFQLSSLPFWLFK